MLRLHTRLVSVQSCCVCVGARTGATARKKQLHCCRVCEAAMAAVHFANTAYVCAREQSACVCASAMLALLRTHANAV